MTNLLTTTILRRSWISGFLALAMGTAARRVLKAQSGPPRSARVLARGAGTTMLQGGTGAPDYVPVITRIAFHVNLIDGGVVGAFECLALAPAEAKGSRSGDFSQNVMYVTGGVEAASVQGDSIRIEGNSECTGIGAGSNVAYTAIITKGGPGATLVLTAGAPPQVFREILLEGFFEIPEAPK